MEYRLIKALYKTLTNEEIDNDILIECLKNLKQENNNNSRSYTI